MIQYTMSAFWVIRKQIIHRSVIIQRNQLKRFTFIQFMKRNISALKYHCQCNVLVSKLLRRENSIVVILP